MRRRQPSGFVRSLSFIFAFTFSAASLALSADWVGTTWGVLGNVQIKAPGTPTVTLDSNGLLTLEGTTGALSGLALFVGEDYLGGRVEIRGTWIAKGSPGDRKGRLTLTFPTGPIADALAREYEGETGVSADVTSVRPSSIKGTGKVSSFTLPINLKGTASIDGDTVTFTTKAKLRGTLIAR